MRPPLVLVFGLWSVFEMAQNVQMSHVCCPVADCMWENSLGRVLAHLRDFHHSEDCPDEFIREHHLSQCPKCFQWYLKLQQHVSKCRSSLATSNCPPDVLPCRHFAAIRICSKRQRDILHPPQSILKHQSEAWNFIDSVNCETVLAPQNGAECTYHLLFLPYFRSVAQSPSRGLRRIPSMTEDGSSSSFYQE